jgi:secreted PhoX family phosphatase
VAPNTEDAVVIPEGYQQAVVIRWGDPALAGAPAFDVNAQTAAAQRQQFGFNNDFAGLLPIEGSPGHFLLVTNHEYTTEQFMFSGYNADKPTREQFDIGITRTRSQRRRGPKVAQGTGSGARPRQPPHHRRHPDHADRSGCRR